MSQPPADWPNSGAELYRHAKTLIPGGTQLLSKRPEQFLPDQWPAYYDRAEGAYVWDLDGRRFVDMTFCGVGSCLLGAADPDVNAAVKAVVDKGSMSTLNGPEEVELAELLCEIHPWADMVRYARTGGEAVSVAVRIARAYTGRQKIAICGYHGWSDWYLAANLSEDDALDGHLFPGLDPHGVPRALVGTAYPFRFNHIEDLEKLIAEHGEELAGVVIEPMRFIDPKEGFLQQVKDLIHSVGGVMILDEITWGWRGCLGGLHLHFGVEPDIATFAKCISNGFPFAAIIGREKVMQAAQDAFISSTYWTERIGPTAALATIKKFKANDLPKHLAHMGTRFREGWNAAGVKHGIKAQAHGWPAMLHTAFDHGDQSLALKTLCTQEMLDRGYLVGGSFYPTLAITDAIIDDFMVALDDAFAALADALAKDEVTKRLRGPLAHSLFKRLT
jgi:glutamate-1-semialdehyde 2,1-aminomutase